MSEAMKQSSASTQMAPESNASPQARADRLRRLRKMTQKSRKSFSNQYNISPGTIQNWETARFGGLTEKGAKLMIYALKREGIHSSFEWLMYGAGDPPIFLKSSSNTHEALLAKRKRKKALAFSDALKIELEKFYQLHPNATHMVIKDDTMAPQYVVGQIVAGLLLQGDHVYSLLGKICIVDTMHHGRLVREIWRGTQPNRYHLLALNRNQKTRPSEELILTNVEIKRAARIIWTRQDDLA